MKNSRISLSGRTNRLNRNGNVLVGCLVVLAVFVILAIGAGVYVASSWRSYVAGWTEKSLTAALDASQLPIEEQNQISGHVERLMTKFTSKEISLEEIGAVIEELVESPVIPTAIVSSIDAFYIGQSGLEEEQRDEVRLQLARYAQGMFDESIDPDTLDAVLDPITTTTPDENDIRLNVQYNANGESISTALRSADEVTDEDLLTLMGLAQGHADDAGVTETPEPVDFSDEIGRAIAEALGEDINSWIDEDSSEIDDVQEDSEEDTQDDTDATDSPDEEEDDGP